MKYQKIPNIKAGGNKKNLSQMKNKNLVFSIKDLTKKTSESKNLY